MLFGLTGLYCAGKNYAASLLEKQGFDVLDVDKLGHIALEDRKEVVAEKFGVDILNEQGKVDRRALGKKVFGHSDMLADLEGIVHPVVNRMTLEWIAAHNGRNCIINAALLHKSAAVEKLDGLIYINAPLLIRLMRSKKRDKLSWKEMAMRFGSQSFGMKDYTGITNIYCINNGGFGFFEKRNNEKINKQINLFLKKTGVLN